MWAANPLDQFQQQWQRNHGLPAQQQQWAQQQQQQQQQLQQQQQQQQPQLQQWAQQQQQQVAAAAAGWAADLEDNNFTAWLNTTFNPNIELIFLTLAADAQKLFDSQWDEKIKRAQAVYSLRMKATDFLLPGADRDNAIKKLKDAFNLVTKADSDKRAADGKILKDKLTKKAKNESAAASAAAASPLSTLVAATPWGSKVSGAMAQKLIDTASLARIASEASLGQASTMTTKAMALQADLTMARADASAARISSNLKKKVLQGNVTKLSADVGGGRRRKNSRMTRKAKVYSSRKKWNSRSKQRRRKQ